MSNQQKIKISKKFIVVVLNFNKSISFVFIVFKIRFKENRNYKTNPKGMQLFTKFGIRSLTLAVTEY